MATYNTFVVVNCKNRSIVIVTSSARKAAEQLKVGVRIEVWNRNELVEKIYAKCREKRHMKPYIDAEREYIGKKQKAAEKRNSMRKRWLNV